MGGACSGKTSYTSVEEMGCGASKADLKYKTGAPGADAAAPDPGGSHRHSHQQPPTQQQQSHQSSMRSAREEQEQQGDQQNRQMKLLAEKQRAEVVQQNSDQHDQRQKAPSQLQQGIHNQPGRPLAQSNRQQGRTFVDSDIDTEYFPGPVSGPPKTESTNRSLAPGAEQPPKMAPNPNAAAGGMWPPPPPPPEEDDGQSASSIGSQDPRTWISSRSSRRHRARRRRAKPHGSGSSHYGASVDASGRLSHSSLGGASHMGPLMTQMQGISAQMQPAAGQPGFYNTMAGQFNPGWPGGMMQPALSPQPGMPGVLGGLASPYGGGIGAGYGGMAHAYGAAPGNPYGLPGSMTPVSDMQVRVMQQQQAYQQQLGLQLPRTQQSGSSIGAAPGSSGQRNSYDSPQRGGGGGDKNSDIGPSVSVAGSMAEARLDRIEMLLEKMAMSMSQSNAPPQSSYGQQPGNNYPGAGGFQGSFPGGNFRGH